jgi:voltage-gated potassium channel
MRLFTDHRRATEEAMASARLRWRLLMDLDEWLTVPMELLSLAWLAIVVWELVSGSSELLETVGTAIWIVFIAEFLVRFALLRPRRRSSSPTG